MLGSMGIPLESLINHLWNSEAKAFGPTFNQSNYAFCFVLFYMKLSIWDFMGGGGETKEYIDNNW